MNKSGYLFVVALLLLSVPLVAQDSGGNIAAVYCTKVQPGMGAQFEAAAKEYMKWHAEKNDSWTLLVWNITTGPDVGSYCWGSFGHTWADFDNPGVSGAEDTAHWQATVAAYEYGGEATFWSFIPDVSKPLEGDVPMYSIIFIQTHFGMDQAFRETIAEFHKAIQKVGMPWNYEWFGLENGGELGTYALVFPQENYASMEPTGKSFAQVLEEAYGKAGAEALLAKWRKIVKKGRTELTQGRPDLSHNPGAR